MSKPPTTANLLTCTEDGCERRLQEHHERNHPFKAAEADLNRLTRREFLKYRDFQRNRVAQVDPCWALATRLAAGLTQQELADEIGVDATVLCRWEKGQTVPGRPGRANRWQWLILDIEQDLTDDQRNRRDTQMDRSL